jgi:AraC family transcriptional regulator
MTTPFSPRKDRALTTSTPDLLNVASSLIEQLCRQPTIDNARMNPMSDQTACEATRDEEPAFSDLVQARSSDIQVINGRLEPCVWRERTRAEILIAIPGERAVAELAFRDANGGIQRQAVSERQICIIPPGQPHQLIWQQGTDLTMILLAPEFLKRMAHEGGMKGVELAGQQGAFDPVIWHLGRALRAELRRNDRLDAAYINSVATVLARHLLSTYATAVRLPVENGGLPRFKLKRAIEFVQENMVDDISFRDVAAHLRMSAYHFARMFKQSTGESPHRYIVRCRIERAKALLSEARLPISDVAFEVGYKSQSHFTTCFGRLTGVTPAAFRAGK